MPDGILENWPENQLAGNDSQWNSVPQAQPIL